MLWIELVYSWMILNELIHHFWNIKKIQCLQEQSLLLQVEYPKSTPNKKNSVKTRKSQQTITFWTETNRKQEENKICRSIIFIFKFSLRLAHFFSATLFGYCFVFILWLISNFSLIQNVFWEKLAALTLWKYFSYFL